MRHLWPLLTLSLLLAGLPARAELALPPGFTAEAYVTGQGFEAGSERGARGIPATSTLAVDLAGALHLARTGARFRSGDVDDLAPVYRVPAGGARLTPASESRYFYGPPLRNPQVAASGRAARSTSRRTTPTGSSAPSTG